MIERLIHRERLRVGGGRLSGLERGTVDDLYRLGDQVSRSVITLEIVLVQPGLSQAKASEAVLHLLACTEVYIAEVGAASLLVHCST